MINRDLAEFVQCELTHISCLPLPGTADAEPPSELYHFADAAGLDAFLCHRTLRALDWRLGWDGPLVSYGIDLVKNHFGRWAAASANPLRNAFRYGVQTHFDPRGTHFDGFIARLFEIPRRDVKGSSFEYALGMSTAELPAQADGRAANAGMGLFSAIYERDAQLSIVEGLCERYEDYFASAIERFGERHRDDFLLACCDWFRHDIGTFLMRFRDPVLRDQREWIGIALALPGDSDERVVFDIVDNRLVPTVAIDVGKVGADGAPASPLKRIAINPCLPFEPTRETLLAYLRSKHVHGVKVTLAGDGDAAAARAASVA